MLTRHDRKSTGVPNNIDNDFVVHCEGESSHSFTSFTAVLFLLWHGKRLKNEGHLIPAPFLFLNFCTFLLLKDRDTFFFTLCFTQDINLEIFFRIQPTITCTYFVNILHMKSFPFSVHLSFCHFLPFYCWLTQRGTCEVLSWRHWHLVWFYHMCLRWNSLLFFCSVHICIQMTWSLFSCVHVLTRKDSNGVTESF